MTATSDVDLLLIYEDDHDAPSNGRKSLSAAEYYTRLTQRLVAACQRRRLKVLPMRLIFACARRAIKGRSPAACVPFVNITPAKRGRGSAWR